MRATLVSALILACQIATTNAEDKPIGPATDSKPSVEDFPPVVVETVPRSGTTNVDAKTNRDIRVTFSKPMTDGDWSWVRVSEETFPRTRGKPHYDQSHKTCVLPVDLEPGKTYAIWLNTDKFQNFKDDKGQPAVPYLLVFETKP
jgi:Bacterial Ig-like domain